MTTEVNLFDYKSATDKEKRELVLDLIADSYIDLPFMDMQNAEELSNWIDRELGQIERLRIVFNKCIDRGFIVVAEGSDPNLYITDKHAEA